MAINKVGTKGIKDGAISAIDFADNTITSGKLVNSAITNALLSNSSITLSGTSIALGASASFTNKFVDWQSVITGAGSSSTAVAGKGYFINTTSAVHTINLPASASIGDFVAIKDYAGTFATYNLTIGRNGHNIQGVANDSLITTNRASLVLVYVDATKGWLYWEEHNVADLGAPLFITATGGTIATSGNFKIHSFTGDGCFVVSCGGNPLGSVSVDYLVVAGGGGGGAGHPSSGAAASGAGAGGFREGKSSPAPSYTASPLVAPSGLPVSATTYPVTVGAGGSAATASTPPGPTKAGDGSNSVFSTITSTGGGYGGSRSWGNPGTGGSGTNTDGRSDGGPGGSGGGGNIFCAPSPATLASAGTGNTPPVAPSQGNNGGTYAIPGNGSTGGGGATQAGGANSPTGTAGNGGDGATTHITGGPVAYAGGGGGGFVNPGPGPSIGSGGTGGGGGGAPAPGASGNAGTANTGGGGGGGGMGNCSPAAGNGGAGGSGIVIIRYKFQ
jgi:hypothetical protein